MAVIKAGLVSIDNIMVSDDMIANIEPYPTDAIFIAIMNFNSVEIIDENSKN